MKYWKMHLKKDRIKLAVVLAFSIIACKQQEIESVDFIAKVNDEYLLKEDGNRFLLEHENDSTKLKQFVRKWVRNRVLLNLAKERKLEENNEYIASIEKIKQDVLISALLSEILNERLDKLDEELLREFFNNNEALFVQDSDLFEMNVAKFKSEEAALNFYNMTNDVFIERVEQFNDVFRNELEESYLVNREYNFPSKSYFNSVRSLRNNQYSRPIKTEQNAFHIVQLISKLKAGSLPDFNLIKDEVKELYIASERKEIINNLVRQSFDEYDIEIIKELN